MNALVRDHAQRRARALDLLDEVIRRRHPGRIAVASSFGTETAVLLDLVATIEPKLPVLFLDTGQLPAETLAYRDQLAARLGLGDVRVVGPEARKLRRIDPDGWLHHLDADACCTLRKVEPLERALAGFDAWITGRKRHHGAERQTLVEIEVSEGRVKVNPLANWPAEIVAQAFRERDLPEHPLVARGFASVGCAPCSRPLAAGESVRAGRWSGRSKTECGIHRPGQPAPLPASA
jgi:phosphoadenosine phosphosulfate reductase